MITPSQIPNPRIKPTWNVPVGVMESIVMYNCRKYGMPCPVLAMPMWEGAGAIAYDLSGKGGHGIITGAKWKGNGLDFDGTNDYAVSPYYVRGGSNPFTIACYFKTNDNDVVQEIIQQWNNTYTHRVFRLSIDSIDKSLNLRVRKNGNVSNSDISTPINSNQWYFATATFDGINTELFLDGVSKDTDNPGALVTGSSNTTLYVGRYGITGGIYFDGMLGVSYVFNVAPTAPQIKLLSDDPYFMFRLPEELYGYAAAAPPPPSTVGASLMMELIN